MTEKRKISDERLLRAASYARGIGESAFGDQVELAVVRRKKAKRDEQLAKNRPKGRPAALAARIRTAAKRIRPDRNRASKIARQLGCSPTYVRRILGALKKNETR